MPSNEPVARARKPGIHVLRGVSILRVVLHPIDLRMPLQHTAPAGAMPAWAGSASAACPVRGWLVASSQRANAPGAVVA